MTESSRRITRTSALSTVAVVIALALSACVAERSAPPAPQATESSPALVDSALMVDEYEQTVDGFPNDLPDGVNFAPAVPKEFDLTGKSEPGVGESFAYFYWVCAWQDAFITAYKADDKKTQTAALDALAQWKSTDFYRDHFDDPQDLWTSEMIDPARAGDPTELIAYFENGCSYYRENNPR